MAWGWNPPALGAVRLGGTRAEAPVGEGKWLHQELGLLGYEDTAHEHGSGTWWGPARVGGANGEGQGAPVRTLDLTAGSRNQGRALPGGRVGR